MSFSPLECAQSQTINLVLMPGIRRIEGGGGDEEQKALFYSVFLIVYSPG